MTRACGGRSPLPASFCFRPLSYSPRPLLFLSLPGFCVPPRVSSFLGVPSRCVPLYPWPCLSSVSSLTLLHSGFFSRGHFPPLSTLSLTAVSWLPPTSFPSLFACLWRVPGSFHLSFCHPVSPRPGPRAAPCATAPRPGHAPIWLRLQPRPLAGLCRAHPPPTSGAADVGPRPSSSGLRPGLLTASRGAPLGKGGSGHLPASQHKGGRSASIRGRGFLLARQVLSVQGALTYGYGAQGPAGAVRRITLTTGPGPERGGQLVLKFSNTNIGILQ